MTHKNERILIHAAGVAVVLLSVFLTSCSFLSGVFNIIPAPPTGVTATTPVYNPNVSTGSGTGGYQFTITWNAVASTSSYNVYHTYGPASSVTQPVEASGGGPGASTTYESNNPITTTSYTFTMGHADPSGYQFYFAVTGVNDAGESDLSSPAVNVAVP